MCARASPSVAAVGSYDVPVRASVVLTPPPLFDVCAVHLTLAEWHAKATKPNMVLNDVHTNENAIGRFQLLGDVSCMLDPNMCTSTEFPRWVDGGRRHRQHCSHPSRCQLRPPMLLCPSLAVH